MTFIVEGRPFYAHKIALLASSEIFRTMFDGHYREKDATQIPIPNVRWPVFHAMMSCIYTGGWWGVGVATAARAVAQRGQPNRAGVPEVASEPLHPGCAQAP